MRQRERAFVVEGVRLLVDALRAGFTPVRLFFDPARIDAPLVERMTDIATDQTIFHEVAPLIIDAIAETETPQGIAAIFKFPEIPIVRGDEASLFVVADGLKDPGNLGTLMRAATAAGAHALYFSSRTVDPYAPKVVRAAMGAHFRLPLRPLDWTNPDSEIIGCVQRFGAEADQGDSYDTVDWHRSSVLVLGSEASGISESAAVQLTGHVSIPMKGEVESLNAAVAGAVILFEAARQRRTQ